MNHTADSAALHPIEVEPFVLRSARESWDVFKADPLLYFAGTVIVAVAGVLSLGILAGPMTVGFIQLVQRRRRGQPAELGQPRSDLDSLLGAMWACAYGLRGLLRDGLSQFASSLVALLLVAVAASIGLLLLVIPGLLVLVAACFVFHEIAYRRLHAVDALRASFHIAKRNPLHVLIVLVGVAALNALGGAVLLGIGTLLTAPYAIVWMTVAYEILTGQTPEHGATEAALDPPV